MIYREDHPSCDAIDALRDAVQAWTDQHAPNPRTLNAVRMLRARAGHIRVQEAAQLSGLSPRSFRRDIKDLAGLSPQSLLRIFRFRNTLEKITRCKDLPLCGLALEAGYTDQAHLTREFLTLGGFTPKAPMQCPGGI